MDASLNMDRVIAAAFLRSDAGLDLVSIGEIMGCSPASVSRLLKEAEKGGLLRESWVMEAGELSDDEWRRCLHLLRDVKLEEHIAKTWRSVENVVVVRADLLERLEGAEPQDLQQTVRAAVGRAAAYLFSTRLVSQLPDSSCIAMAWGGMAASFVRGLRVFRPSLSSAKIVPVIGHVQAEDRTRLISAQVLSQRVAQITGATALVLSIPARIPLAVDDLDVARETLKGDARFKEFFFPPDPQDGCTPLAKTADALIMGIGSLTGSYWPHLSDVEDLTEGFVAKLEDAKLRKATLKEIEACATDADRLAIIHHVLREYVLPSEGVVGDILSNWVCLDSNSKLFEPTDGWAGKFNLRLNALNLADVVKIAEEARASKRPGVILVSSGYPETRERERILRAALETRAVTNLVIDSHLASALIGTLG